MCKKLLSIICIIWIIISSIGIRNVQANPAIIPSAEYAIAYVMVASGYYASDDETLDYTVDDYYKQIDETRKKQWAMVAATAATAGRMIIDQSLTDSVVKYLQGNYHTGNGTIEGEEVINTVVKNVRYGGSTVYINGLAMSIVNITYHGNAPAVAEFDIVYNGQVVYHYDSNLQNWISSVVIQDIQYVWDGADLITWYWKEKYSNGTTEQRYCPRSISGIQNVTNKTVDNKHYRGDDAGFGSAVNGSGKPVAVPSPAEVDWPDTWIDDLEKSLNEADNPSVDDETAIEEGQDDWDWYVDKDTGELYRVPKGTPPRHTGDRLISPIPLDPEIEPNIPDEYPTIDDPDIETVTNPPEIEKVLNPDGTTTTTTTQTTEKTERWYDPDKKKMIERKTTTTTKREVITNPDGSIVSDTTTTETSDPTIRETPPPGDDSSIDWGPLKRGMFELTRKFPFSLPWDLYNSFKNLGAAQWNGKIPIDISTNLVKFKFDIDLSMFHDLILIVKKIELLIFDIGLILFTRRLMGGGV